MAYVSDELTHFVGRKLANDQDRYNLIKTILQTRQLKHPALPENAAWECSISNQGSMSKEEVFNTTIVCFCDIPFVELASHMNKFSHFGVAFPKSFMISQQANPVFYVAMDLDLNDKVAGSISKPLRAQDPNRWDEAVRQYLNIIALLPDLQKTRPDMPNGTQISNMQQVMDFRILSFIKPVDINALDNESHGANVYMEREWRIVGRLRFNFADISRVIVPKPFFGQCQKDFPELEAKIEAI